MNKIVLPVLKKVASPDIYRHVKSEIEQRRVLDLDNMDETDLWHMDLLTKRLNWIGLVDYLTLVPSAKVTPGVKKIIEAISAKEFYPIRELVTTEVINARSPQNLAAMAYQRLDDSALSPADIPMAHLVVQVLALMAIDDEEATKVVLTEAFEGEEPHIDYHRTSALVAIATRSIDKLVTITPPQQDLLERILNIAILINKYVTTTYSDTTSAGSAAHVYIALFNGVCTKHESTIYKIIDGAKVSTLEELLG